MAEREKRRGVGRPTLYPGKRRCRPLSVVMTTAAIGAADGIAAHLTRQSGFKVSRSDAICRACFRLFGEIKRRRVSA